MGGKEAMGAKVGIDNGERGRPAEIQFEDEATETVGVGPVTTRFLNRFTGHALGRSTYRDSSFFRKLFWLLVFLTTSGYMSYGIIEIVKAYTSGLTTTATQMEPREMIPFPAIIICPQNFFQGYEVMPFDFSGLFSPMERLVTTDALNVSFRELLKSEGTYQPAKGDFRPSLNDVDGVKVMDEPKKVCVSPFKESLPLIWNSFITDLELKLHSNKFLLDPFPFMENVKPRILHCSFNDEPCNITDFQPSKEDRLGECLTFNYRGDKKVLRQKSRPAIGKNKPSGV
ncbi:unnamed protein product [Darwinula stevensoni]|uniref:Uncharacterized protein n=1 Tax=Darwinula stevensoni TaxID=69355 RepID=A0A7R8XFG9_9CRUS|nr:unnamed protein product [Darwinula stevensoni]CAG0895010.1 unnamed protein product [Darwinula stevensoni]